MSATRDDGGNSRRSCCGAPSADRAEPKTRARLRILEARASEPPQLAGDLMAERNVITREEWLKARLALLQQEKALTRAREDLAAARRALPWVAIDKGYRFATEQGGLVTLADLFAGRTQLIVYHFMFDPSWSEGCSSCSFFADNFAGAIP